MSEAAPDHRVAVGNRILPMRDDCVLVELADLEETLALYDALRHQAISGVRQLIPAARTLMIEFDPSVVTTAMLQAVILDLSGSVAKAAEGPLVEIPVLYDGEDLSEVAALLSISREEVVRLHTGHDYLVAFTGFAPGFAYLAKGDPRLNVPRRQSPRTMVPAGSVGLAGAFSGIYPKASPGGWQLIGRTPLDMFDLGREPASLLQPGQRVRFRDMTTDRACTVETKSSGSSFSTRRAAAAGSAGSAIEVVAIGLPVLFQDRGRPGLVSQGIGRSGAADLTSFAAANRLVGNPDNTVVLEMTLGGLSFRLRGQGVMAMTGAEAKISVATGKGDAIEVAHHQAFAVEDGDVVTVGTVMSGMRSYLSVRGGFDIAAVLDSRATDMLAQIGPEPLKVGEVIQICDVAVGASVALSDGLAFEMPKADETVCLDVVLGPRTDWFTPDAVARFLAQDWRVSPQTSRVGMRLEGEPLERSIVSELPSEATIRGAIQVPASGQPVLFLVDHPLTGGYPVIANVAAHHLDLAGQIPVGTRIRFVATAPFAPQLIAGRQR